MKVRSCSENPPLPPNPGEPGYSYRSSYSYNYSNLSPLSNPPPPFFPSRTKPPFSFPLFPVHKLQSNYTSPPDHLPPATATVVAFTTILPHFRSLETLVGRRTSLPRGKQELVKTLPSVKQQKKRNWLVFEYQEKKKKGRGMYLSRPSCC